MLIPLHLGTETISLVVLDKDVLPTPISIFIEDQVPEFVAVDHSGFVDFIEEYVKWSESTAGNPTYEAFNITKTASIDYTPDSFVDTFKNQFLKDFPNSFDSGVDQRKLIKNIKDFYKTKGTQRSYKLLFRILFGEDPLFYYPKKDIFRASDGNWKEPTILKVTKTNDLADIFAMVGRQISQKNRTTGAVESYGYVEGLSIYEESSYRVVELELSDAFGTFFSEGLIECTLLSGDVITEYVYPTLSELTITNGGSGYSLDDTISIAGGFGAGYEAKITSTNPENGKILSAKLSNSGVNYRSSDTLTVSVDSNGGTGAVITTSGGVALDSREGYYASNDGLLSSSKKLQDNNYYQDFSYVIKSSKNLNEYSDIVKKLIHPAGTKLFGDAWLQEVLSATATSSQVQRLYETPLVGHYTSYAFETIQNLRANGTGGSGGVDLYPNGYGWSAGLGNTYVDENGTTVHSITGVSGPIGGSTHEAGTTALNAPQGEQYGITNGVVAGATTAAYWLIYPHPASRGITEMPWDRPENLYDIDIPTISASPHPVIGEIIFQEIPWSQDAVGVVKSIPKTLSTYKTMTVDVLSGLFDISNKTVFGGTTGLLHGTSGGYSGIIHRALKSEETESTTSNKFNYIKLEDFFFGIEK